MERRLTSGTISVVIVTWNSAPFLRRCLAAVASQTYPDLELIHIDNASIDDSVAVVHGLAPQARQIINDSNRGFSAAVNQGVRAARGEFVLLLNPDAFLDPGYAAKLVEALTEAGDTFGMATGKLLQAETGLVDSKGIRMTRSGRHFDVGQGTRESGVGGRESEKVLDRSYLRDVTHLRPDRGSGAGSRKSELGKIVSDPRPPTPDSREVFGVSGAAAMYRLSFVRDVTIGGEFLDEDFFTFREDADVAWRGRLFGWRALYVPDAVAHHVRTVTPSKRRSLSAATNMHGVKNRFLLRLKNEGLYLALRNAPFELTRDLIAIAATLIIERTSLPALTWLWRNRRRIMEKRRAIQGRRSVSDRQLAGWFR
ncbi:MAG TPA: glycosyltransferase family 2 protein [Thermoanaerobaculia bacterium]|jgi:GT2 family glycosyltransferase|nr:glycosyltransferase family 2 protein [Thermoanaerobaculia bacterium]